MRQTTGSDGRSSASAVIKLSTPAVRHMHYIVAVDSSPASKHAAEWLAKHVLRAGDAATALTVLATPAELTQALSVGDPMFAPVYLESLVQDAETAAKTLIQATTAILSVEGVSVDSQLLRGDARDAIIDWTASLKDEATLVVGTRGLGAFKRAFLGSTADYCVHHCSCPVLVVRPPAANKD